MLRLIAAVRNPTSHSALSAHTLERQSRELTVRANKLNKRKKGLVDDQIEEVPGWGGACK